LPPPHWLQAFEAAARTLNFTQAGQELYVSQSAISQRIRLLEARLGQALFIRHPHSLTLTEAGRAWLPSVQEAFSRLEQGTAEVFGPEPDAPVTIRTTPALQHYWLAPRLAAAYRAFPDIGLRVVTRVWAEGFVGEDADIEICYGYDGRPDVVQESLGAEFMVPVCAPRLAGALASPADLAGQTLLHATGFTIGWPAWLALAGVAAVADQTRALWCDTQISTLRLAACGCGVALAHRRLLPAAPELVAPFDLECATEEAFWLMRPANRSLREPARRIWAFLIEAGVADYEDALNQPQTS
jgi:LysR family glycine cleavage system transcriptional activator